MVVEPIDFEAFIAKNKTVIQNDPQRELLIYPADDVSVSTKIFWGESREAKNSKTKWLKEIKIVRGFKRFYLNLKIVFLQPKSEY